MNKATKAAIHTYTHTHTHTQRNIFQEKEEEKSIRFKSKSHLLGTNQIYEGVVVQSLPEIPEMLLQNLSNTFSSWCSNKSFKMPFTSSGQVVE